MADFHRAMDDLFKIEGYDERILDREAYGIERRHWEWWFLCLRENRRGTGGRMTRSTANNLLSEGAAAWPPTKDEAEAFYYTVFWLGDRSSSAVYNPHPVWDLDELPHPLADQFFRFAVNAGHTQAVRELQRALSRPEFGWDRGRLEIDGIYGPKTARALAYSDHRMVLSVFIAHIEGFYRMLHAVDEGKPLTAWVRNRIYGG